MKKAPIPRDVKSSFSLIEKLQKDYVAQNAPVIVEIRKIIEQRKDILKRYGIEDAIENVQKIMRSHNELQQIFNSNQNTLVIPALHEPDTSQGEIIRSVVKEELQKALERHKKFHSGIMGKAKEDYKANEADIRNYARYLLTEGSIFEKRDLLGCLKSKIVLKSKNIII